MELANVRMESSGEKWVGVANRAQDAASKIATSYTLAELEFFRKAVCDIISLSYLFNAFSKLIRWNTSFWKVKGASTA